MAMNTDPAVMEYDPNTFTQIESNAQADKFRSLINKQGWGFWAIEKHDEKKLLDLSDFMFQTMSCLL